MKIHTRWSCTILYVLHNMYIIWAERFKVVGPSKAVITFDGNDVILPALLSPALNAEKSEVRWFREDYSTLVLWYQNHQIKPERQSQSYKGRTTLFLEDLQNGNVSLRLLKVHASDTGRYRCLVNTEQWEDEAEITLSVEVLGSQPSISIRSTEDQQIKLECSSEKWSSQPEIIWKDMNGVDMTSGSTLTSQQDSERLLSVSSIIPIKSEFNVFSCLMRSKASNPNWPSALNIYNFSPGYSGWSVVFWISLVIYLIAMALLIFSWKKMKEKNARYEPKVNFLQLCYLRKEIELAKHPALKVIKRFRHEDLLKVTEYYKPYLAYVIKSKMTSILQSLEAKHILTTDDAQIFKSKEESNGTEGVKSFISDMMKDNMALTGLWEALTDELVRFPSPNMIRIMEEVADSGKKLLEEIEASVKSPVLDLHLNDLYEKHKIAVSEAMKSLYDHPSFGDSHIRAVNFETQYTELMVFKQDTVTHNEIEHELLKTGRSRAELEEGQVTEKCERIWTEQIFKRCPESIHSANIVASGTAGIGKTTMVQKIMFDWARGTQYQRFAFVFLFKFRELNLLENEKESKISLTKLIVRYYNYLNDQKLREILQNPKSLLFIFDGLDEYKHKLDFTESQLCSNPDDDSPLYVLVASLVYRTLLKGCSVLITSRPTSLESLNMDKVDRFVQILGFFPEQRLMYFNKFLHDVNMGTTAFQYVEENPILYPLCFNPLYCWIICSVLKSHFMIPEEEQQATLGTVTDVFAMFIHNILTSHRREADNQQAILVKLGKLAYYGVDNQIFVFSEKQEMSTFGLQPFLSSPFLSGFLKKQTTPEHTAYTFYHSTLQEFMAACSFYLNPSGCVEELLLKLDSCKDGRFEILIQFMVGLARPSIFKTLGEIMGEFEKNTMEHILKWVKEKAEQALQGGKSEALQVCQWLSETQNKQLIRDAIGENLKMDFSKMTLSPLDCAVLASVIRCFGELEVLNLSESNLTINCIRRLVPGFIYCKQVKLNSCGLTSECCSALSLALSSPHTRLVELEMNKNNFEDSGVNLLCEGLMSPNCKLEILWLVSCGLTSGCCSALSSVLSTPHSPLIDLWLNYNNLQDSGVDLLCEGLNSTNCKLKRLRLWACALTAGCCAALSSAISSEHTHLINLSIGANNLEDTGVCILCEGLKNKNCKLGILWVSANGISECERKNLESLQDELNKSGRRVDINI